MLKEIHYAFILSVNYHLYNDLKHFHVYSLERFQGLTKPCVVGDDLVIIHPTSTSQ